MPIRRRRKQEPIQRRRMDVKMPYQSHKYQDSHSNHHYHSYDLPVDETWLSQMEKTMSECKKVKSDLFPNNGLQGKSAVHPSKNTLNAHLHPLMLLTQPPSTRPAIRGPRPLTTPPPPDTNDLSSQRMDKIAHSVGHGKCKE